MQVAGHGWLAARGALSRVLRGLAPPPPSPAPPSPPSPPPPQQQLAALLESLRHALAEGPAQHPAREALWDPRPPTEQPQQPQRPQLHQPQPLPAVELALCGEVRRLRALLRTLHADLDAIGAALAEHGTLSGAGAEAAAALLAGRVPPSWEAAAATRPGLPLRAWTRRLRRRRRFFEGWLLRTVPSRWPLGLFGSPAVFLRAVLSDFARGAGQQAAAAQQGGCAFSFGTVVVEEKPSTDDDDAAEAQAPPAAPQRHRVGGSGGGSTTGSTPHGGSGTGSRLPSARGEGSPWLLELREVTSRLLLTDLNLVGATWRQRPGANGHLAPLGRRDGAASQMPTLCVVPSFSAGGADDAGGGGGGGGGGGLSCPLYGEGGGSGSGRGECLMLLHLPVGASSLDEVYLATEA